VKLKEGELMSNFGMPTDEQLKKINKLAKRTLSKDEVFVFSGKSAGDMIIPNRYTRISPELLKIMVADAKKGVSFMLNHNWSNWGGIQGIPYGKVFDGRIIPSNVEGETVEMHLDKYIIRDDEIIDGVSANALIKRIETGILSDTSIGFSTDRMTCSICGMNYFSRDCSHYRGTTYTMEDGTKKTCYVTAMPPSIILPNTNNVLFEESIVWDGAYPGAVVTQAKHGDIIETPSGKYSILDEKEELPENTMFYAQYHNGHILTMVKKSEHKKIYTVGTGNINKTVSTINDATTKASQFIGDSLNSILKGVENSMNEKVLKMLLSLGFSEEEANNFSACEATKVLNSIAEKWDTISEVEPQEKQTETYMTQEKVKERLGAELSADEVLKLAKEGLEYRKQLIDETVAMGVRAMGNDFKSETWKATLSTMETAAIKDIMANFEVQAKANIPAGRKTDPQAGTNSNLVQNLPDEAFKVGK